MENVAKEKFKQTQIEEDEGENPMITFSSCQSCFESPILSESRVMNRSIRGDSPKGVEISEVRPYED